jgi:hypothetical protein
MATNYVFSFRNDPNRTVDAAAEAAWGAWFQELGAAVVDFGHRVGQARLVGGRGSGPGLELSGYVVVAADSLDEAVALAQGCPGLNYGGQVEVGETVAM